MTYYFNSQEQIAGDDAYNKHDFQDALVHYKKAYAILNKIAAQRGFQSSKGFKDALAYVLTEIILTSSDVMQDIIHEGFDYKELKKLWREIHESVNELDVVYAELKHYVPRNTTIEHYRRVYTTLADVGEAVSDNMVDLLDEDTPDNDTSKDAYLKSAINWLLKANKWLLLR